MLNNLIKWRFTAGRKREGIRKENSFVHTSTGCFFPQGSSGCSTACVQGVVPSGYLLPRGPQHMCRALAYNRKMAAGQLVTTAFRSCESALLKMRKVRLISFWELEVSCGPLCAEKTCKCSCRIMHASHLFFG